MKVRHDEGVATHIDPEPCVVVREDGVEASVGERIGQPLSRERFLIPGALLRAPARPGVVTDPGMHVRSFCGNREISPLAGCNTGPVRIGKARSRSR